MVAVEACDVRRDHATVPSFAFSEHSTPTDLLWGSNPHSFSTIHTYAALESWAFDRFTAMKEEECRLLQYINQINANKLENAEEWITKMHRSCPRMP